jgi:hypothetical protein
MLILRLHCALCPGMFDIAGRIQQQLYALYSGLQACLPVDHYHEPVKSHSLRNYVITVITGHGYLGTPLCTRIPDDPG